MNSTKGRNYGHVGAPVPHDGAVHIRNRIEEALAGQDDRRRRSGQRNAALRECSGLAALVRVDAPAHGAEVDAPGAVIASVDDDDGREADVEEARADAP